MSAERVDHKEHTMMKAGIDQDALITTFSRSKRQAGRSPAQGGQPKRR